MANVYYLDKLYNIAKLNGDKTVNFKVAKPSDNYDAANKKYVDDAIDGIGGSGSSGGVSNCSDCTNTFAPINGNKKANFKVAKPIDDYDAVNKKYVNDKLDNFENAFAWVNTYDYENKIIISKNTNIKNSIYNKNLLYKLDYLSHTIPDDGWYLVTYTISASIVFKDATAGDRISNGFRVYQKTTDSNGSTKLNDLIKSHIGAFGIEANRDHSGYAYCASMTFLENLNAKDELNVYLFHYTDNADKITSTFYYGRKGANSSIVAVRLGPKNNS